MSTDYTNKLDVELEISTLIREKNRVNDALEVKKWEYSQINLLVEKAKQSLEILKNQSVQLINELSDKRLNFTHEIADKEAEIERKNEQASKIIKQGKELEEKNQALLKKEQEIDKKLTEALKIASDNKNELTRLNTLKDEINVLKDQNEAYRGQLDQDYQDRLTKAKQVFIENL